jgi:O-antigen/teichoic acid export membrane protein
VTPAVSTVSPRGTRAIAGAFLWLFSASGSLKEQALRGTIWLVLAEGLSRLAGVIKVAVLGRLLSPRDFGLFGVALLIQQWIGSFTQTGISATLIRKRSDIHGDLDTAWTIGLIRGSLVFVLIFLLAPWGAAWFRSPEATPIIRWIGLLTLMWELVNPGVIYLRRELDFRKDVAWRLSGVLPGLAAGVILALIWRNVWALVASLVAARIAELAASYWIRPHRPRLHLDPARARELLRTGKWFSWMNVAAFFEYQLDSLATARLLGAGALGYYQVAAQLALLPTAGLGSQVAAVLFPAFSRVEDRDRLKRAYLGALGALALVIAPLACALSLYSDLVVRIVLGARWSAVALALAWLAWAGLARALGSTAGALLQANGRLKVAMSLQLLRVAALAALLYAFTPRFGFTGTAAAVAGAGLVTSAIQVSIAARSVEARWLDLVAALKHAAVACLPLLALRLAILPLDASWLLPAAFLSGTASLYFVARGLKEQSGLGFPGFFSGDRVASGRP